MKGRRSKSSSAGRIAALLVVLLVAANLIAFGNEAKDRPTYQPTWESLDSHPIPKWFDDAKFGIFIHWGAYAVPAYHEWYVTFMSPRSRFAENLGGPPYTATQGDLSDEVFQANTRQHAYEYQREHWGKDFAYDDFIPMFKAEKFRPAEWAKLFKQSGARYVVLTAKHGEEFALWPSEFTPRNAGDMGPRRDLVGDLTEAVRAEGLKMGYYHNTTYSFWDERYPNKEWVEYMNGSIKELIDRYHPSILWGDVRTGPARDADGKPLGADHWNSKEVLAYFYNNSPEPDQVVANDRWGVDESGKHHGDYYTPERKGIKGLRKEKWETCDSLDPTSWGYNRRLGDDEYMSANKAIDYLVDIVSKNGNLLLNIGPKADGTIPQVMQDRLLEIGKWLEVNGEAIYGTEPHGLRVGSNTRFTKKGNTLYAICLKWPEKELSLLSLGTGVGGVADVRLLGSDAVIDWSFTESGRLNITPPAEKPCKHAFAFKIILKNPRVK